MTTKPKNIINNYPIVKKQTIEKYLQLENNVEHKKTSKNKITNVKILRKNNNKCIVKAKSESFKLQVKISEKTHKILITKCDCSKKDCKHIIALLYWLKNKNKNKKKKTRSLNLKTLATEYCKQEIHDKENIEEFLKYCKLNFDDEQAIERSALETVAQANNAKWRALRYARITASKIYEAAFCTCPRGALYRAIMGEVNFNRATVNKGVQLEEEVIKLVEKKYKINVSRVGLYLNKDYPIFGASPDGISPDYCIEIKCPRTKESFKKLYSLSKTIAPKVFAQIQMQMLFCNKRKGLFCLAHPNFLKNKHVHIIQVDFDEVLIKELMSKAQMFWETAIFPVLMQSI